MIISKNYQKAALLFIFVYKLKMIKENKNDSNAIHMPYLGLCDMVNSYKELCT